MTTNFMKKNYEKNGKERTGVVQSHQTLADPLLSNVASLKSVCASVAELARSAPKTPSRIKLSHGSTTVEMEWPDAPAPPPTTTQVASPEMKSDQGSAVSVVDDGFSYVRAPMVGTFYRANEPGAAPLVSVGDQVQVGQPVGILEVMKMLSTLEADVAGRVVEVLVDDGQSVEYQQRLIAVDPAGTGKDG